MIGYFQLFRSSFIDAIYYGGHLSNFNFQYCFSLFQNGHTIVRHHVLLISSYFRLFGSSSIYVIFFTNYLYNKCSHLWRLYSHVVDVVKSYCRCYRVSQKNGSPLSCVCLDLFKYFWWRKNTSSLILCPWGKKWVVNLFCQPSRKL